MARMARVRRDTHDKQGWSHGALALAEAPMILEHLVDHGAVLRHLACGFIPASTINAFHNVQPRPRAQVRSAGVRSSGRPGETSCCPSRRLDRPHLEIRPFRKLRRDQPPHERRVDCETGCCQIGHAKLVSHSVSAAEVRRQPLDFNFFVHRCSPSAARCVGMQESCADIGGCILPPGRISRMKRDWTC